MRQLIRSELRLLRPPVLAIVLVLVLALACAGATQPETLVEGPTGDPGISDTQVLFGQSAAFSGPAAELGNGMRIGIEAAFHEINQAGGVHGRQLAVITMNDSYETDFAASNTQKLIENEQVFALIGAVGTPTSRAASPIAHAAGVPFIAPFTGAEFLRDPDLDNVVNVRASYYQETEEMVARLTEDLGVTRVAVMYQDDSYGQNGLDGTVAALKRRDLKPVAAWHYPRNTIAVKAATQRITQSDPEAVIMIGAYEPVARAIEILRRDIDPVFMTVSFVGSNALSNELGNRGEGVYVSQVVPLPDNPAIPVVANYHEALEAFDPRARPGFVSLEGYLAGRLAIVGLETCGPDLSRDCFLHALRDAGTISIDGIPLKYGPEDNQGSNAVFLTVIGPDGEYRQVEKLGDDR